MEKIKAVLIRALKTAVQAAVATCGSAALVSSVNWALVLDAAAMAFILSLAMNFAGTPPEVSAKRDAAYWEARYHAEHADEGGDDVKP